MFIDKDGNRLKIDAPHQFGDEKVGPDFLRNATPEMLKERGISVAEDPPPVVRSNKYWPESAEDMKERLLEENRTQLLGYLSSTDWTIIRKYELGIDPPEEISTFRSKCREAASAHEDEIGTLSTQEELSNFRPDQWPPSPGDVDPNATE